MKNKLSLNDLRVKSFVTTIESEVNKNVVGGALTVVINTLPAAQCISQKVYSACATCQFQCYTTE